MTPHETDGGFWRGVDTASSAMRILAVSIAVVMAALAGYHGNLGQAGLCLAVALFGGWWTR